MLEEKPLPGESRAEPNYLEPVPVAAWEMDLSGLRPCLEQVRQAASTAPAAYLQDHPEIVPFTTRPTDRETVNRRLREAGFSPLHNIRRVEQIDEIPLLGAGKTDYRALQKRLEG